MTGIRRVSVTIEPIEQAGSLMIATILRELAQKIEQDNRVYMHNLTIVWTPDDNDEGDKPVTNNN